MNYKKTMSTHESNTLQDLMGPRGSATYNEYISLEQDIRLKLKKYVIGFLKLERITWEKSSAALLEKVKWEWQANEREALSLNNMK